LSIGAHAEEVATFTLTSSTLPFTGTAMPVMPAVLIGVALIRLGGWLAKRRLIAG
jgi:hypothetical protein